MVRILKWLQLFSSNLNTGLRHFAARYMWSSELMWFWSYYSSQVLVDHDLLPFKGFLKLAVCKLVMHTNQIVHAPSINEGWYSDVGLHVKFEGEHQTTPPPHPYETVIYTPLQEDNWCWHTTRRVVGWKSNFLFSAEREWWLFPFKVSFLYFSSGSIKFQGSKFAT